MRRSSIRVAILAAVAAIAVPCLAAQVQTGKPITIKTPKTKLLKFKGEVLSATNVQMIVRSRENPMVVRSFTYSEKVREKMHKIIDAGGYQSGDKVEIRHEPGSDVAVKISGKPSKPR